MDKSRTLMNDAGLPKELWVELVNTSNFVKVRISEKEPSPYKTLFNAKPNLNQIKCFGCRAYVTSNAYKKKLDRRSEIGVFVGYEQEFEVYRILMDKNQTVIKSRDVHFIQDELPYKDASKEKSYQSSL
ncbi:hypothetical protein O181_109931 [Austropuccinia psidii MF-1]|uniref:Retroviral polymerase SH3-like domain-containing protein n=1 Tax=Austropuccinia psidii MF-1 TaxID=1389203 RepID=A0A9Q3PRB3_9BASI|nr:hypothetical protein [Austropuccinia psidii MF-1]